MDERFEREVRGLSAEEGQSWLSSLAPSSDSEPLRTMPGRETYRMDHGGRALVVKRMRSEVGRERWYERLRGARVRCPAEREFDNLRALRAAGFSVPGVRLWARDASGDCLVAMEYVAHTEDLEQRLTRSDSGERRLWLERLAELVERLHRAGFYHRDLYLTHVVLQAETDELTLLDVGRVRRERQPRQRWFIKDLAALYHSCPRSLPRSEALRFLRSYLARRAGSAPAELARSELRAFARAVLKKARRIAAHTPRSADTATFRPAGAIPGVLP